MGLFNRKTKKSGSAQPESARLSPEKLSELVSSLADDPSYEDLNRIAKGYMELGEVDEAITYFERSLAVKKQMGVASTSLVKLYMKKRSQAAANHDNQMAAYWLEKSQSIMQMSKDILRGNTE